MIWKNKFILIVLAAVMVMDVKAGDQGGGPEDFLRIFFTKLTKVGEIRNLKEKESKFVAVVNRNIDLDWIANFILGRHQKNITKDQRKQFIDLYSKYLASSYRAALSIYKSDNYELISTEKQKEHVFMISTFVLLDGKKVRNVFRIVEKNGKYHITDIVVEGISFIAAKRADLNSMIMSKGFNDFLEELRARNDRD
ncbi:MAG: ABC transporter substrate-binding protein [Rickettsiales bacterium]|jgi:phospholipid transport system substrate-binding protein|nr:ABC transporter substrate-binding protein [Rickettsiales bacterium]